MGKKKKTSLNYVFANNLPKAEPVLEEASPVEVETSLADTSEEVNEEPVSDPVPEEESSDDDDKSKPRVDYPVYREPIGAPDNGINLCIILSLIIIVALGFLIWHERSWRSEEESGANVLVEDSYDTLTKIVRNYVATIEEPNKQELCDQLRKVYLSASTSDQGLESDLETIKSESRKILGFDERKARTNEHEWQKLFGPTGVIDSWLTYSGIEITNENKKDVFKAIAEGLK